ncbi:hypothetical protein B0A52_08682 [Exophiala mesophila]|uniref:Uncharacterized protein n=1 Tax=Exophiala mesophila TaxID=212818 RepID=A0A438MWV4_EXOME|nr:hypothetical protein B0A52_08682 [Exophiala mesophila]
MVPVARNLLFSRALARTCPTPAREYILIRQPCVGTGFQSMQQQSSSLVQRHPPNRLYSSTQYDPSKNSSSRQSVPESTSTIPPSATTNTNPGQLPKFSFNDLGATPRIKIFIYVVVAILATVETYTYSIWIWQRWFKKTAEQEED